MSSFSLLERQIGSLLGGSPKLRAAAKALYQRVNFSLYGERGFSFRLEDGLTMTTPSQIIGLEEPERDVAEYFGYFDASPWSHDERYYVVNHVKEGKGPAEIVVYDLEAGTRKPIGTTPAWTWQQGAMPRWLSCNGKTCLAFNSVEQDILGTNVWHPGDGSMNFLRMPLQAVNQQENRLYAINYLRLHRNGTEYGYKLKARNFPSDLPMEEDGIWSVDIEKGDVELIITIADLVKRDRRSEMWVFVHEINHVSVSPDGQYFVFVHRYRGNSGQYSKLYLSSPDGRNLSLLMDEDMVSHYTWISSEKLLAWARSGGIDQYYIVNILSGEVSPVANEAVNTWGDGHPTFSVTNGKVISDSYADRKRQQHLFITDAEGRSCRSLGDFFLPLEFTGENRIDLHPRWSPDGRSVSIDSGLSGLRRNYILGFNEPKLVT